MNPKRIIPMIASLLIFLLQPSYAADHDSAIEIVKGFLYSKNYEAVDQQLGWLDSNITWNTADQRRLKGSERVRPFLRYLRDQETMDRLVEIHQNKDGSISMTRNVCLKKFLPATCPSIEIDHVIVKDGKITQWTAHFTKTNGAE